MRRSQIIRIALWSLVLPLHLAGLQFCPKICTFEKLGLCPSWASLVAQLVENPPAVQETPVQFLGWELGEELLEPLPSMYLEGTFCKRHPK